jgi:hypothetical protein
MTRHTLFPFCRRSHRRKRSFIALVPEFPLCFSLALSSLSPFATPQPFCILNTTTGWNSFASRITGHRPTLEGKPQGTQTTPFLKCGRVLPFLHLHYNLPRRSSNSLTLRFVTLLDGHWMLGDCHTLRQCRDSCHISQFKACQGMPQCVYPESHV